MMTRNVLLALVLVVVFSGSDGAAQDPLLDSELFRAVEENDIVAIVDLLDAGADPNAQDSEGWTALIRAVGGGNVEAIEALLDAGADPNAWFINERMARRGLSALIWAVSEGNVDAIEALLDAGADPNVLDSRGIAAVTWAVIRDDVEAIEALLDAGADPNVYSLDDGLSGGTALIWAVGGAIPMPSRRCSKPGRTRMCGVPTAVCRRCTMRPRTAMSRLSGRCSTPGPT